MTVDAREDRRQAVTEAAAQARARTSTAPDAPFACVLSAVEEHLGVEVIIAQLGPGIAGLYSPIRGGVLLVNGKDTPVRRRFTLAHELGHHCLGHGERLVTETMVSAPYEPPEVDANQFAAEFLAPQVAVEEFVGSLADASPTLELVCRVSNYFAVSPQMARYRLTTCGVLTDSAVNGRLDSQIFGGEAKAVYEQFELSDRDDLCATPEHELPRLPETARGTILYDLASGAMSPARFAALSGRDEQVIASVFPA